jgi:eukaryotic-like serine/threonine-protein kinase
MAILPGRRLGPYEILSVIGAGGMGEMYRARDTRLDCTVAIKVLRKVFVLNSNRLARFQHRAKVLATMKYLTFRQSIGWKCSKGVHFLIMQPVFGWVKRSLKRKDFR